LRSEGALVTIGSVRTAARPATIVALALVGLGLVGCRERANRSANVPDVPIYPGAVLREAVVGEDLDPTEYYVVSGTTENEILQWYRQRMPEAGWEASGDPDGTFVFYHTVEGCYGFVGTVARGDGTVELQVSEQRSGTRCYPYFTPDPTYGTE
jgi:hypothetical protein